MRKDNLRPFHVDFELTSVMMGVERMVKDIQADMTSTIHQLISLVGYKYLSENIKDNEADLGYGLDEDLHYENLLIDRGNAINILKKGISQITQENDNVQAADVFYDLFNLMDFETFSDNDTWLLFVEVVEMLSETMATLGEIVIFLTKYFPSPNENLKVTDDIVRLMTTNQDGVKNIYDPFASDATLIAEIGNVIDVENYYGQHPNIERCILAKMTLLTNDVNYKNIFIKCNDITNPINWDVKFDLCVSIPPFARKIRLNGNGDERFKSCTPRRNGEFVYILDMLHHLDENGSVKVVVPNGVLFTGADQNMRRYLVDNEIMTSVIGLPGGIFNSTAIPTTLLIMDKKSDDKEIYYLNAMDAEIRRKVKRRPYSIVDIDNYVDLLANKRENELVSKNVPFEEIAKNDYVLSMNRYIDTERLKVIDIEKTISNIEEIKNELREVDEELKGRIGDLFL